jgi:acyl CoA:acetate/3-ketoacid CoA transferase alpha subunit
MTGKIIITGSPRKPDYALLKETVDDLYLIMDQVGMSDWERDFVTSMKERDNLLFLSSNQKQKIADLVEKYDL